ncbi:MAG TPA: ABC transporter permease [Gammaproteobacteria bacterium]|nr:ABC transporter permease [Gammaproteobacteria bacterium]
MNQLKLALRQLRLRPGLSLVVILMLALGIGATTAMFSLYHQVLLRPLPVPEPEQLVNLAAPGPKPGGGYRDLAIGDFEATFSYPMFRDLERVQTGFTGIAASVNFIANLSYRNRPASGGGWLVSGSYFRVLNLRPALGRLIGPEDEPRLGESAVVVLSHDYWQNQFGADPKVIGETLMINGYALEIIGVAPAGFSGTTLGARPQVFVPLTLQGQMMRVSAGDPESRLNYWLYLFARLAPGVTLERAAAQLNGVYSGILNEVELPLLSGLSGPPPPPGMLEQFRERQIAFSSGARGKSNLPATVERPLTLLLGVTVLVLLIVCVNIANLLLARGAARTGEMAIRASLGASRGWLVRQLFAESLVLIAIGGLASLAVAALVVRLVTSLLPTGLIVALAPGLSSAALLFAAGASLATVLVFGLLPAMRASGTNPAYAMRAHATRSSGGRGTVRFRTVLTTAQIAFSMVLLVLAGLFTRSLMNVGSENIGIYVDSVVSFNITPRLNGYDAQRVAELYDRVEEALAAQPGVLGVASTWLPLLGNFPQTGGFSVEGFDVAPGANTSANINVVGSGFFDALGVPLLAGRVFTDRDTAEAPQVAIVNESFARKFNIGGEVGRHLALGTSTTFGVEIVGIVADAKLDSLKSSAPPIAYFARRQFAAAVQSMFYYVRVGVDPDTLLAQLPRVIAQVDPEVPVTNLHTMTTEVHSNVYIDRLLSTLSAGFAALATLLAGIGLYGVLAYNVTQRTREIGLRLALGAAPGRLRSMVLKQVGAMALVGAAIGLAAALALGRVAESVLYGLSGHDPLVIAAAVVVLGAVVLAGSWVPARRASNIAPTEALRYE